MSGNPYVFRIQNKLTSVSAEKCCVEQMAMSSLFSGLWFLGNSEKIWVVTFIILHLYQSGRLSVATAFE